MDTLQLSPSVLNWAAAQIGESLPEFSKRISKPSADKIALGRLSYAQVVKFAKLARVSLSDLFLDTPPPPRHLPLADFRTHPSSHPLSRDFFDTFDDIEFKQAWYREFQIAQGNPKLPFIGKFKGAGHDTPTLAADIRSSLALPEAGKQISTTPETLFSELSQKCEAQGILIFKNGVVGNNTRRPLSVEEFRGFAISDDYAPVIFINGADAPAAWVFTLAHELAHLWLGDSGVSDAAPNAHHPVERYCNEVAAEILVPKTQFLDLWVAHAHQTDVEKLETARSIFKVSNLVIARKALDLKLITRALYNEIYRQSRLKKGKTGGGDFYRTFATRNSKNFSKIVSNLAISGVITLGQAGNLLNTNPNNVVNFYGR